VYRGLIWLAFLDPRRVIDHAGFRLEGYSKYREKLDALDIHYSTMDLPELNERRLFVRTPTGILLELVFRENGG